MPPSFGVQVQGFVLYLSGDIRFLFLKTDHFGSRARGDSWWFVHFYLVHLSELFRLQQALKCTKKRQIYTSNDKFHFVTARYPGNFMSS